MSSSEASGSLALDGCSTRQFAAWLATYHVFALPLEPLQFLCRSLHLAPCSNSVRSMRPHEATRGHTRPHNAPPDTRGRRSRHGTNAIEHHIFPYSTYACATAVGCTRTPSRRRLHWHPASSNGAPRRSHWRPRPRTFSHRTPVTFRTAPSCQSVNDDGPAARLTASLYNFTTMAPSSHASQRPIMHCGIMRPRLHEWSAFYLCIVIAKREFFHDDRQGLPVLRAVRRGAHPWQTWIDEQEDMVWLMAVTILTQVLFGN